MVPNKQVEERILTMADAIDKESKMKFIVCAATLLVLLLLWGAPAIAGPCPDTDSDGICDDFDNCIEPHPTAPFTGQMANPAQDDTDGDLCGNVCDPDDDHTGTVTVANLFAVVPSIGLGVPEHRMFEPVNVAVTVADLFQMVPFIGFPPGPSGTSAGALECP